MINIKKYSVTAIGNAMLDLVCEVPDQFLSQEGISKGVMNLVSRERSNYILKLVQPIKETAGGSAANTISTLAKLGLDTVYIGKIAIMNINIIVIFFTSKVSISCSKKP